MPKQNPANKPSRPVMCVETKQTFDSAAHAAEVFDTSKNVIYSVINGHIRAFRGCHFVYADSIPPEAADSHQIP